MAFVPAPFCAKHVIEYTLNGKPIVNVLNYRYPSSTPAPADIQADGEALADWVVETLMPQLATPCIFQSVTSTDISQPDGIQYLSTTGSGTAGDRGPATSNQVALVASLRTGYSGRSARGRIYLGGMAEADVTGNTVDSIALAALLSYVNILIGVGATKPTVGDLVVLSRQNGGVVLPVPFTRLVTQVIMNPRVDTQRRRLPK